MYPNYKLIYTDIINEKYPEKIDNQRIASKIDNLSTVMDILELNKLIFGETHLPTAYKNQRLRSYDENSVLKILDYQKKNKLNNTQVANHFKMSRNTLAKWKNIYKV